MTGVDPGTLAGYDQVLSISVEALNAQLQTLYNLEFYSTDDNGPQHLINHELDMALPRDDKQTIRAYIKAPQISIGTFYDHDVKARRTMASIKFTFQRAPDDYESKDTSKDKDSIWTYKTDDGRYVQFNINGWEMRWRTEIGNKAVKNIVEDILEPAASPDSLVAMSEPVQARLAAVDTEAFRVSTVFCVMQAKEIRRSFDLTAGYGKNYKTTAGEEFDSINFFKSRVAEMLVAAYAPIDGTSAIAPTPDSNPFILGYTISHKDLTAGDEPNDGKLTSLRSPSFFTPTSFDFSVSGSNEYSSGTLDYCMLTQKAFEVPYRGFIGQINTRQPSGPKAGVFKTNGFGRVKQKAGTRSNNGVLVFCQDIFVNHWIASSLAPHFYVSPDLVGKLVTTIVRAKHPNSCADKLSFEQYFQPPKVELSRNNKYRLTNSFKSGRHFIDNNFRDDPTQSMKLEYDYALEIKYKNLHPLTDSMDDTERRLLFTVTSSTHLKVKFDRRLAMSQVENSARNIIGAVGSVFGASRPDVDYHGDDKWYEVDSSDTWLNLAYTFEIGAAAANELEKRGTFSVSNLKYLHFETIDEKGTKRLRYTADRRPGGENGTEPGLWQVASHSGYTPDDAKLIGNFLACAGSFWFDLSTAHLTASLQTTMVMPAGGAFMFKGLSADSEHNVFTTVTYDTPTRGTVQTRDGKA